MVYSIALRLVGDAGLAEEVAQDCFIELHRSLGQIVDPDHLRFWLRKVAVHRSTDCCRRRALRPESRAEEWMDDHEHSIGCFESGAESGSAALAARIESLLASMPEALRVIIVLRFQEELVPEEIAILISAPIATVKSNLQRGLNLLRRKANVLLKEYIRE